MADAAKVEACVDRICELGCDFVSQLIEELRAGREHALYADLDNEERQALLRELASIMAVYQG
jgi:hypothetical protein